MHDYLIAAHNMLLVLGALAIICTLSWFLVTIQDDHARYRMVAVTMLNLEAPLVWLLSRAWVFKAARYDSVLWMATRVNRMAWGLDVRRYHLLSHEVGLTCYRCTGTSL